MKAIISPNTRKRKTLPTSTSLNTHFQLVSLLSSTERKIYRTAKEDNEMKAMRRY
jgi:hypothetical protein